MPQTQTRRTKGVQSGPRSRAVVARVHESALGELVRVGYGDLSMDAVARAAGINRSTLYRRWANKSDLVATILEAEVARLEQIAVSGDLRDALCALVRQVADNIARPEGRALAGVLTAPAPELRDLAAHARERGLSALRAPLERARDAGRLAPQADIAVMAHMLFFGAVHWVLIRDEPVTHTQAERLVASVLPDP